jgi:uncharacterized protein involved in exopolysaccharide biosynthesis
VTIIDYCRIAWRARVMVLGIMVSAVVIALVFVLSQPKIYSARATILAPKESGPQGMSASLGALLGAGGGGGGGGRDGGGGGISFPALLASGPSLSTNQDMFAAILRSRSSRQEVIGELAKKYGADVGSKLFGVDVSLRDKGIIALVVESTDGALAAETANLYFQVLDRVILRLGEQATRRQENFYADQLQRAAREVTTAEEAVLKFQAENRVVQVDTPARGAVDAGGNLRGQIMALELQREVLRMRMTDQHPQMRELDKQIAELKKQYSKNLFGAPMDLPGDAPGRSRKEFFVSTEKMTPMQFAFLKLYRNLKIQEAFYTGALQGLEQLKYNDGAHNVQVEPLDPAVPPETHTRPRILLTLFGAAVGGLLVSIFAVYGIEYIQRLLREERATRSRTARLDRRADVLGSLAPPDDSLMQPDPFSVAGRSRQ